MVYVLGIDGGGTKTKGVISTSKGHKLAEVQVGPTNPNTVEQNILKQEIKRLMSQLYKKLGEEEFNKVKQIFAGISGAGHPTSRKKLTDFIKENLPQHINVKVDHDSMIALYSVYIGQPYILKNK